MAHQSTNVVVQEDGVPPRMDYKMHERTYEGFMAMAKWGAIGGAVLMVLLYFIVQP